MKELLFGSEARAKILKGVTVLADAVRATLGPKGRNVLIDRPFGMTPIITKDGVTVAKEVEFPDKFENMGAQMVKEVAAKTASVAGDGTTTATILAHGIYSEGAKLITAGHNPIELKRGIDKAVAALLTELDSMSKPTSTKEEIAQVGAISANNDRDIGDIIAEAMDQVGKDGVITVDESSGLQTTLEVKEGMQLDRGYVSPKFVTDTERDEVVLDNPLILITDQKILTMAELRPTLEFAVEQDRALLIISDSVEGDALETLILNKEQGNYKFAAVNAPGFGDRKAGKLKDIAAVTGGTVLESRKSLTSDFSELSLGSAEKVVISKESSIILGGEGDDENIDAREAQLNLEISKSTTSFDTELLQERLASLTGGVGVLKIGAATETEMKEKKHRVEDALAATRAAVAGGIVEGGGTALIRAQHILDSVEVEFKEQELGVDIIRKIIESPLRQIVKNAGLEPAMIISQVKTGDQGFNARTEEFVDLFEAGVIDPTNVTKAALLNAASVASLLLTTEVMIAREDELEE